MQSNLLQTSSAVIGPQKIECERIEFEAARAEDATLVSDPASWLIHQPAIHSFTVLVMQ